MQVLLGVTVALMLLVFTTVADSGSITSTYGTCYEAVAAADATGDDADGSYSGEPGWLVKEGGLSDVGNVLRTQSGVGPLLKGGSFVALGRSATLSGKTPGTWCCKAMRGLLIAHCSWVVELCDMVL